MPTEPWEKFLNRDFALVQARDLIEIAGPLLREVVNYATEVFHRCLYAGHKTDIDNPAFALFYHTIELTDGVEVLLSRSCCAPTIPLLRSTFEALLSLEYLFREDYKRRSRTWDYCHLKGLTSIYNVLDLSSDKGNKFNERFKKEYPGISVQPFESGGLRSLAEGLEAPEYDDIASEYRKMKKKLKGAPHWYALFSGPQDLRSLAKTLNQTTDYDLMYRKWSMVSHAGHVSAFVTGDQGNIVAHQLRYPSHLKDYACHAINFLVKAIQLMMDRFRPGEYQQQKWVDKVSTENIRLNNFPVVETPLPF